MVITLGLMWPAHQTWLQIDVARIIDLHININTKCASFHLITVENISNFGKVAILQLQCCTLTMIVSALAKNIS